LSKTGLLETKRKAISAFLLPRQKARFLQMPGKFVPLFEPLPGKSGKTLSPDFSGGKFARNLPVLGAITRKIHEDFGQVGRVLRRPVRGGRGARCGM
jgi:hypothetical protein